MLDLTLVKKDLYKIKWIDGIVMQLKAPTQKTYLKIQQITETEDLTEIINTIYETILEILNKNMNGKVITNEEVEEFSLDDCVMIMEDYFNFYSKQMEDKVVFLQSQQETMKK